MTPRRPPPSPAARAGLLATLGLGLGMACGTAGACPQPLEACGGVCLDVATDVANCGACGLACTGGLGCSGGRCVSDADVACANRRGGAFVTFEACGQVVKVWSISPTFNDDAAAILGGALVQAVPVFDLLPGADCDAQWSFHVNALTPAFAAGPGPTCSACPATVQAALPAWLAEGGTWCPSTATVVAVDRRP